MHVADEPLPGAGYLAAQMRERSRWQEVRAFCRRYPRIPLFTALVAGVFVLCLFAPLIAPYGEKDINTFERLQGPSRRHLAGTDQLGRDTFSRLLYGGRLSISLGLMAVAIASTIGIIMGVLAGYFGGWVDMLLGRLVDAQLAFPELPLILLLVAVYGNSLQNVMLVIALTAYPGYFRVARGQVIQAREFEFVTGARALGAHDLRLMFRHILPNCANPLIIQLSLACGGAVLLQSTLGFFGLGPKAGTADWGTMFFDGLNNFRQQPWLVFGPSICVFLSVLSFFMIGDALRDALDPHLRGRRG